jgi:hypothetical protein
MILNDSSITQVGYQVDSPGHDELNRLLSAAIVSKNFQMMLLSNPELAVASGYQGEKFNLSRQDHHWLLSAHPTTLVELAASMVTYQQSTRQDSQVKLSIKSEPHFVRVN